jgi:hypothetical protein
MTHFFFKKAFVARFIANTTLALLSYELTDESLKALAGLEEEKKNAQTNK